MITLKVPDPLYPPLLFALEEKDQPKQLYWDGVPPHPTDRYVAIVGTRRATRIGKSHAAEFAYCLARRGIIVVSGLAFGIDTAAHEGALEAGGKTIAVLGSGHSFVQQHHNKKLAERIVQSGALITEFAAHVPPNIHTFPQRNRIIAGMCPLTIVIEAPEKSGALITARLAAQFSRDVAAVPGPITSEIHRGTNKLLKEGAGVITCLADVFEYAGLNDQQASVTSTTGASPNNKTPLSKEHAAIYKAICHEPQTTHDLVQITGLPVSEITTALTMLEIQGFIEIAGSTIRKRQSRA